MEIYVIIFIFVHSLFDLMCSSGWRGIPTPTHSEQYADMPIETYVGFHIIYQILAPMFGIIAWYRYSRICSGCFGTPAPPETLPPHDEQNLHHLRIYNDFKPKSRRIKRNIAAMPIKSYQNIKAAMM